MTISPFGNVVPIQIDMLQLVGYEFIDRTAQPATSGNARKRAMREGLHSLRHETGSDFGYDPLAWREFLIKSPEEYSYAHPYAFSDVDQAVLKAVENPDVKKALNELSNIQNS